MTRPTSPCPFYWIACGYVPMAHEAEALRATNDALKDQIATMIDNAGKVAALRAENARLREVLEEYACTCEAGTCAEREGFRDWPCGGPARAALTPTEKETEA